MNDKMTTVRIEKHVMFMNRYRDETPRSTLTITVVELNKEGGTKTVPCTNPVLSTKIVSVS